MTSLALLLTVTAAGAAGAVTRVVVESMVGTRWQGVPLAVPLINVSGSAALGVLAGLVMFRGAPDTLTTIVGTGFCGGFTTFSTAMVNAVRLVQDGRTRAALVSVSATAGLSVGACALGMAVTAL